jgi:hypothetical protein
VLWLGGEIWTAGGLLCLLWIWDGASLVARHHGWFEVSTDCGEEHFSGWWFICGGHYPPISIVERREMERKERRKSHHAEGIEINPRGRLRPC